MEQKLKTTALFLVFVLALANIYTGATIQELGIPGLMTLTFGSPGRAETAVAPSTAEPEQRPVRTEPIVPTSLPLKQRTGQFRVDFANPLLNYDFDTGQAYGTFDSPGVDFFFKPDSAENPYSAVGVDPLNKAIFSAGFPDLQPWEVPQDQWMASFYSVPQYRQIPCRTDQGLYCLFSLIVVDNGLTINYTLYSSYN